MQPALLTALPTDPKLLISVTRGSPQRDTRGSLSPQREGEASLLASLLVRPLQAAWSSPSLQSQQMKRYIRESVGSPAFLVIEIWQNRPLERVAKNSRPSPFPDLDLI